MRNLVSLFAAAAVLFASLAALPTVAAERRSRADARFEQLAKQYIEDLLRMSPETATSLGDHRYDARLGD